MKKTILYATLFAMLTACGQGKKLETESIDTISVSSSSAAVDSRNNSERKFIRSSELKFKVKNVSESTYQIEDITRKEGGFVTFTNLASNIDNTTLTEVSADSSLEIKYFTVTNEMTIRVPNLKLDTTLKQISKLVDFLDYRIIKADDVSLQLLTNNLTQQRMAKNEQRLTSAIDNRGKKLNETTHAEETILNKQEEADHAKVSNLSLSDQINYSTINISMYQRQAVSKELIANQENINRYKPSLGSRIIESFMTGWTVLSDLIVFIVKLWGLILIGVIIYILYKRYGSKLRKPIEI